MRPTAWIADVVLVVVGIDEVQGRADEIFEVAVGQFDDRSAVSGGVGEQRRKVM